MPNLLKRNLPLLLIGLCTIAVCETVTARVSFAEVYLEVRQSFSDLLAEAAGTERRHPRDLMLNGEPLSFTPYASERPVGIVLNLYLAALRDRIRPADFKTMEGFLPGTMERVVAEANRMIAPKVALMNEDTATVTQFFDGDGNAARDYLLDRMIAGRTPPTNEPKTSMPGVTVLLRRPKGAPATEVIASRFEDAPRLLEGFGNNADPRRLPNFLRPPEGARLIADLGDRGTQVISRTIISSGARSAEQWALDRRNALENQGFELDTPAGGHGDPLTFGARRGAAEADFSYVVSPRTGDVTEIITIRQPSLPSPQSAGMDAQGSET